MSNTYITLFKGAKVHINVNKNKIIILIKKNLQKD